MRKASESVIDVKVDLTAKRESWAAKSKDGDGALPEVPSTGYTGPGSGTIGSEDAVGADVTDMPPIAPDDASETETEDSRRLSSVTAKMADLLNSSADADGNDEGTVEGDAAAQGGETSVPGTEKHTDSHADDGCRGKNEDGNGEEEEEKEEEEGEGENDGESSEQEGEDEEDDDEEEEEEEEEDLAELNEETKEALNQETETEKRERQKAELLVAFKAAMADPTKPQVWEKLELNQEILFVPGYSRLAEESFPLLDRVAAFLRKVSAPVRIEGHINTVKDNGTILRSDDPKILVYEDNCTGLQLSERRAAAVSAYLNHRGVPKNFLVPIGCGGERPLTTEKSLLQTNRRVEIHFLRTDLM